MKRLFDFLICLSREEVWLSEDSRDAVGRRPGQEANFGFERGMLTFGNGVADLFKDDVERHIMFRLLDDNKCD